MYSKTLGYTVSRISGLFQLSCKKRLMLMCGAIQKSNHDQDYSVYFHSTDMASLGNMKKWLYIPATKGMKEKIWRPHVKYSWDIHKDLIRYFMRPYDVLSTGHNFTGAWRCQSDQRKIPNWFRFLSVSPSKGVTRGNMKRFLYSSHSP